MAIMPFPSEKDSSDEQGTRANVETASSFLPARPLTIDEGKLSDAATGDVYTVTPAEEPGRTLVRRGGPGHPFGVMTETLAPVYDARRTVDLPAETARMGVPGRYHVERDPEVPSTRLQRRIEEHRLRVAQYRARLGDPDEALDRFVSEAFDPEAMRRIAREFARDYLAASALPDEKDDDADGR